MMAANRGRIVRPLGAFERTIDLYMHRNPVQFSLVAELDRRESPGTLAPALRALQDRHPLLAVAVDRTGPEAVFRESEGAIPLEVAADGTPWQAVVAAEQTRPISPMPGPLARAVLVPGESGAGAVVLTFAHQIADGVGGLRALLDLVAALGGEDLARSGVPKTQEDLLARTGQAADDGGTAAGTPPEEDERMNAVGELVPFSGRVPHVDALALDRGLTERLVRRCRLEHTSVHAALCAAAATVLHQEGREFVRILSPMDLRRAVGLPDEVAIRFAGARTSSTADGAKDFWALARRTSGSLSHLRAPSALRAGAAAVAEHAPEGPGDAEAMMAAATAADIQITNLGVAGVAGGVGAAGGMGVAGDAEGVGVAGGVGVTGGVGVAGNAEGAEGAGAAHPGGQSLDALSALWGPAQTTQLRGEHVLGVVTVGGRLRMTELTHDPVAGLVPRMGAVLAEACAESPRG